MAIHGKLASIRTGLQTITLDNGVALTSVAGLPTRYVQTGTVKFLKETGATIYDGLTTIVSSTSYDVDYHDGIVRFKYSPASPNTVKATWSYYTLTAQAGGFNWTLTMNNNMAETLTFGQNWMTRQPGQRTWTATMERYFTLKGVGWQTAYDRDQDVYVSLFLNSGSVLEGRGKVESMDVNAPTEELVTHTLTLAGQGTLHSRAWDTRD